MALEWTIDLATGVDDIDNQHKELFNRINSLLDACRGGKGREEVKKTILFLDDYVVTHFANEERYMRRFDYPEYPAHTAMHKQFMRSFSELKAQFEREGAGVSLVVSTNRAVVEWLQNHIRKVDTALGGFLKTKV